MTRSESTKLNGKTSHAVSLGGLVLRVPELGDMLALLNHVYKNGFVEEIDHHLA